MSLRSLILKQFIIQLLAKFKLNATIKYKMIRVAVIESINLRDDPKNLFWAPSLSLGVRRKIMKIKKKRITAPNAFNIFY